MKPYRMAASRPTAAYHTAVLKRSQCFFSSALTIKIRRPSRPPYKIKIYIVKYSTPERKIFWSLFPHTFLLI